MNKKTLRLLSLTGLVIFIIFFIKHNADSATRSLGSKTATEAQVQKDIDKIKQDISSGKGKDSSLAVNPGLAPGSETNAGLDEYDPAKDYKRKLELSPILLFSKSFCPYSARLKKLLDEHYNFEPEVVIIELDKIDNGLVLQKHIGSITGRRTVPNLIINGVSRGGSDELVALHEENKLLGSLSEWAGTALSVSKKAKKIPDN